MEQKREDGGMAKNGTTALDQLLAIRQETQANSLLFESFAYVSSFLSPQQNLSFFQHHPFNQLIRILLRFSKQWPGQFNEMRITQLVELTAALIATVLNLILYFLLTYTITAALYSYCVSSGVFTWYLPKNGFLFICTSEFYPRWFEETQVMLFGVCYLGTIMLLVCSFIYRLSTLRSSWQGIKKRTWIPVCLCSSIFIITVIAAILYYLAPAPEIESKYRKEVMEALNLDLTSIYYLGGQYTIDGKLNIPLIVILGFCSVYFTSGIIICVVCWIKIGSKLRGIRQLAKSTYKYHRNFYILLALQTCLPISFYALPITILVIMGLTQHSIDGFSYFCGMCLSFAQVLDPLLAMYFISDYRLFLLRKKKELFSYFGIYHHAVHIFNTESSGSAVNVRM